MKTVNFAVTPHLSQAQTLSKRPEFAGFQHNGAAPKFQGGMFNALAEMDFTELGKSTMRHNQLIYGSCIVSRMLAASTRSWNEVREHGIRDILGWSFWFYATPMIQRGFVKLFAPKDVKPLVINTYEMPVANGPLGFLKKLNWTINPLARWNIASSAQIKERQEQALTILAQEVGGKESELFKKAEPAIKSLYERAVKSRNFASASAIGLTIALLGIGIQLLNIWMTRQNMKKGRVGVASH